MPSTVQDDAAQEAEHEPDDESDDEDEGENDGMNEDELLEAGLAGAGEEEVAAVVPTQKKRAYFSIAHEDILAQRVMYIHVDVEHGGQASEHVVDRARVSEVDPPHAAWEGLDESEADRVREPCLSDASRAGQGDEACGLERRVDASQIDVSAPQSVEERREVRRACRYVRPFRHGSLLAQS